MKQQVFLLPKRVSLAAMEKIYIIVYGGAGGSLDLVVRPVGAPEFVGTWAITFSPSEGTTVTMTRALTGTS